MMIKLKVLETKEPAPGIFFVAATLDNDKVITYTVGNPGEPEEATIKVTALLLKDNPGLFDWEFEK